MIDFENLTAAQLYKIGVQLGELTQSRPDIVYRLIIGTWDGLHSYGHTEDLGSFLNWLQNRGIHHVPLGNLRIPFAALKPAGAGAN